MIDSVSVKLTALSWITNLFAWSLTAGLRSPVNYTLAAVRRSAGISSENYYCSCFTQLNFLKFLLEADSWDMRILC